MGGIFVEVGDNFIGVRVEEPLDALFEIVDLATDGQTWRAERITIESLVVIAELRPVYSTIGPLPADAGRALPSAGVAPTPTAVALIELPDDGTGEADSPVIAVAASNTSASWRRVPLSVAVGGSTTMLATSAAPATLGQTVPSLGRGQSAVFDLINSFEVVLVNPTDWLESRDDDSLADGANLALAGSEIIQFGEALPLGDGRFRLGRLLRGRRGTEWAMDSHPVGERFVVLERERLRRLPLTSAHTGSLIGVTALGLADGEGALVEIVAAGEAMRPPSPVHLRAVVDASGTLRCTWVRRSRRGWAWLDGVDSPLGCATERYRTTLSNGSAVLQAESMAPGVDFGPGDLASLGSGPIDIAVVQIGDLGVSRAATLTISNS
ncbi:MAG: hypothetical protein M3451_09860 [Chloroflexota bacterium]|nr:hypothetical protein [Chloroflexota bacterium]